MGLVENRGIDRHREDGAESGRMGFGNLAILGLKEAKSLHSTGHQHRHIAAASDLGIETPYSKCSSAPTRDIWDDMCNRLQSTF